MATACAITQVPDDLLQRVEGTRDIAFITVYANIAFHLIDVNYGNEQSVCDLIVILRGSEYIHEDILYLLDPHQVLRYDCVHGSDGVCSGSDGVCSGSDGVCSGDELVCSCGMLRA